MQTIIQLSPDELKEAISSAVHSEISKLQPAQADKLLTRKQAASMLNVSLPTISAWEKSDELKATRIGSRVYFKQSDLLK
jgi:excisionase family DNA binding protein